MKLKFFLTSLLISAISSVFFSCDKSIATNPNVLANQAMKNAEKEVFVPKDATPFQQLYYLNEKDGICNHFIMERVREELNEIEKQPASTKNQRKEKLRRYFLLEQSRDEALSLLNLKIKEEANKIMAPYIGEKLQVACNMDYFSDASAVLNSVDRSNINVELSVTLKAKILTQNYRVKLQAYILTSSQEYKPLSSFDLPSSENQPGYTVSWEIPISFLSLEDFYYILINAE